MLDPPRTIDIARLPRQLFINGEWVEGLAGTRISVRDPFDDSEILSIAEARAADVDRAVAAARAAFPAWAALAASERGRLLYKLVEKLEACCDELAELESIDTARRAQEIRWLAGSELSNALQNHLGVQFPSARRDREE